MYSIEMVLVYPSYFTKGLIFSKYVYLRKVNSRVFHKNKFFQKKIGGTHHALALGLVWKDPKGFLISTKFRGSSGYLKFDKNQRRRRRRDDGKVRAGEAVVELLCCWTGVWQVYLHQVGKCIPEKLWRNCPDWKMTNMPKRPAAKIQFVRSRIFFHSHCDFLHLITGQTNSFDVVCIFLLLATSTAQDKVMFSPSSRTSSLSSHSFEFSATPFHLLHTSTADLRSQRGR